MDKQGPLPSKHDCRNLIKELPRMKMVCHDGQLKSMGNVPTKTRPRVVPRGKKSTKSTPLAKEKLCSHKMHSLKKFPFH